MGFKKRVTHPYPIFLEVTTAQRVSDMFIARMITDRIGRHEVLLPINQKHYNFWEKKNSQVIKESENLH